jgi:hypothetical protein
MQAVILGVAVVLALIILGIALWLRASHVKTFNKHYALTKLKLYKLAPASATRKRIEASQRLFEKGWKASAHITTAMSRNLATCSISWILPSKFIQ